jgi:hypothetical protein
MNAQNDRVGVTGFAASLAASSSLKDAREMNSAASEKPAIAA